MGVEQSVESGKATLLLLCRHRLLDPEVCRGPRMRMDDGLIVPQVLTCGYQSGWIPGELDAGHVRQRLPAPADGELHQLRDQRREQQQRETQQSEDRLRATTVVVIAVAPTTPPQQADGEIGRERDETN